MATNERPAAKEYPNNPYDDAVEVPDATVDAEVERWKRDRMPAATKRPSARCGICNYVNDLRADGTLGRHHTWIGGRYAGQCPGTGKTPEETAIERRDWEAIVRGE